MWSRSFPGVPPKRPTKNTSKANDRINPTRIKAAWMVRKVPKCEVSSNFSIPALGPVKGYDRKMITWLITDKGNVITNRHRLSNNLAQNRIQNPQYLAASSGANPSRTFWKNEVRHFGQRYKSR